MGRTGKIHIHTKVPRDISRNTVRRIGLQRTSKPHNQTKIPRLGILQIKVQIRRAQKTGKLKRYMGLTSDRGKCMTSHRYVGQYVPCYLQFVTIGNTSLRTENTPSLQFTRSASRADRWLRHQVFPLLFLPHSPSSPAPESSAHLPSHRWRIFNSFMAVAD